MVLGHIIALEMVNKCVKFHTIRLNSKQLMATLKYFYDEDNNNYSTGPN